MRIRITLLGELKRFAPGDEEEFELDLEPGTEVAGLIRQLGIDPGRSKIVLLNGRPVQRKQILSDSDQLTLLPAVEGG
ncbi:MAG: MoaD/ThiS family protein [Desulfohalobiaceae bacterium]|nr:MoaD/ThiS family protein [Desulfohalobiaceae bacterium]